MSSNADDGTAQLAQHVVDCAERTLAVRGVKIDWCDESNVESPPPDIRWRRRRGGLVPLIGKLLWKAIKAGFKLALRDVNFGPLAAKGVLDPATGRFMIDFGSFATIYDGQNTYGGRSGRSLSTLHPFQTPLRSHELMWLLRMLRGTTDATKEGEDSLHGTSCMRFAVHVDLEQASTASGGGLHVPAVDRFEELRAIPMTVWTDGEHIRRVRLTEIEPRKMTLELWDYGLSLDEYNWKRLPTFKSPDEAAHYSGETESRWRKLRRRFRRGR